MCVRAYSVEETGALQCYYGTGHGRTARIVRAAVHAPSRLS
jgi:hypothetical protein